MATLTDRQRKDLREALLKELETLRDTGALADAEAQQVKAPPVIVGEWVTPPPAPALDPYAAHRAIEQVRNVAALTFNHPTNVRARKVAALREQLCAKFEPRFPPEGRSDRVYQENYR